MAIPPCPGLRRGLWGLGVERVDELERSVGHAVDVGLDGVERDAVDADENVALTEESAPDDRERRDARGHAARQDDARSVGRGHLSVHPAHSENTQVPEAREGDLPDELPGQDGIELAHGEAPGAG